MKNPNSVENMGAVLAPRQTVNAGGDPDTTSRGTDAGAPMSIPETPLHTVEDFPGARESTPALDGPMPEHGGPVMGAEDPEELHGYGSFGSTVVPGVGTFPADTDAAEHLGVVMFNGNAPDTLVDLSKNGGYSKYNTPTGGETRAEGGWPDGGLRGYRDSEVIDRAGVDKDA